MNSRILVIAVAITTSAISSVLAQARAAYLSSTGTSAVDAKGIRHRSEEYSRKLPPWMVDCVSTLSPDYPLSDRASRHEGSGYFQVMLDVKTGAVTRVIVLKSTGFSALDVSAVLALRRWTWRPGKWKEIDMPVTFTLSRTKPHIPPGSVPLPIR
jgi:TonB family protein